MVDDNSADQLNVWMRGLATLDADEAEKRKRLVAAPWIYKAPAEVWSSLR